MPCTNPLSTLISFLTLITTLHLQSPILYLLLVVTPICPLFLNILQNLWSELVYACHELITPSVSFALKRSRMLITYVTMPWPHPPHLLELQRPPIPILLIVVQVRFVAQGLRLTILLWPLHQLSQSELEHRYC